jgi:hypothetical protein
LIFTIAVMICFVFSLWRLAPLAWKWRGQRVCELNSPPFLTSLVVLSTWFAASASPYRVPLIVDGSGPDVSILHVVKRGLRFHEECAHVWWRHHRYGLSTTDRQLFHYRFALNGSGGKVPGELAQPLQEEFQVTSLEHTPVVPAPPLSRWNAEGWYVTTSRGVLAFTTENGQQPPPELLAAFSELRSLPRQPSEMDGTFVLADECLGFCYDPYAGLGMLYSNQRCDSSFAVWHCK